MTVYLIETSANQMSNKYYFLLQRAVIQMFSRVYNENDRRETNY